MMAMIGGFLGGYAILCRCDVFGNAQTANLMHFVIAVIGGNFWEVLIRIGAILLYMAGIISVVVWNKKIKYNVAYYSIIADAICFIILGFLPEKMNNIIALYPIFIAASIQWTAFPGVYGYACSTIFSTNNLKQLTIASTEYIMKHGKEHSHKAIFYGEVLIFYHIGVTISVFAYKLLGVHGAWAGLVFVMAALVMEVKETWKKMEKFPSKFHYNYKKLKKI